MSEQPLTVTSAGNRFERSNVELINFMTFLLAITRWADESRERLKPAMRNAYEALGDTEKIEALDADDVESARTALHEFEHMVSEMSVCRAVDTYLVYIGDLLGLIFRKRPEAMRSSETVTVEFVLGHDSMDDLISSLAERRVERLSYEGLTDVGEYVSDKLHLDLFDSETHLEKAVAAVENRNLIVHRGGVVDQRYLARVPKAQLSPGDRLILKFGDVLDTIELFGDSVRKTDRIAALKWGLPQMRPETSEGRNQGGNLTDAAQDQSTTAS